MLMENYEEKEWSPCKAACPVHTDVRKYIEFISFGMYEEAFKAIKETNTIPSVCSRICHHPCERECRRGDVDESLSIRDLKRFAIENSVQYRKKLRSKCKKIKNERIAIIGSGPSGLTAAADLVKLGYEVTIFEKFNVLGGMLATAIPPYRLPREVLSEDIEDIVSLGVEVKVGVEIGKDIKFNDLKEKMGYSAVLIAVGLGISKIVNIPGINADGVITALQFLNDIAFGKKIKIGKKVIVIGGGNVAIDVARSALRVGAEDVTMVCLESRKEMPAWEWEINEATEEGIKIICSQGPNKILEEKGKVKGLEMKECLCVFDEQKRFNPKFDECKLKEIYGDTIIISIGQASDLTFLKDTSVNLNERGLLIFDKDTMQTSCEGIFACGEVVTGPGAAIEAVASGHKVARCIDRYLSTGKVEKIDIEEKPKIGKLPEEMVEKIKKAERQKMRVLPPEARKKSFIAFELGLTESEALVEARRCMNCGAGAECIEEKCAVCLTCVRICPFGVPIFKEKIQMPSDKCQSCGICATECPALAISMKGYSVDKIKEEIATKTTEFKGNLNLLFTCVNQTIDKEVINSINKFINIPLVCTGRLDTTTMLKCFEYGIEKVGIISCKEGQCRFVKGDVKIKKRVEYVKEMLKEVGFDENNLRYFEEEVITIEKVQNILSLLEGE